MERPRTRKVQMWEIRPNPSRNELMPNTMTYLTSCPILEGVISYLLFNLHCLLRVSLPKRKLPSTFTSKIDRVSLSSLYSRRTLCHEKTLFVQHEMKSCQCTSTKRSFDTHVSLLSSEKLELSSFCWKLISGWKICPHQVDFKNSTFSKNKNSTLNTYFHKVCCNVTWKVCRAL